MKKLLLLEDNTERIAAFQVAVKSLGEDWEIEVWNDAPAMLANCENYFEHAALISLDHDLNPQPGGAGDPGTGLEVAKFLAGYLPLCPVIIHSSNTDRAWSMHNELRFAHWQVDRVGPIGEDWIPKLWLPKAHELIKAIPNTVRFNRPPNHPQRMARTIVSLEGLAIGDALGEMLAYRHAEAARTIRAGLPSGPWFHTDDTEMALSIVDVLRLHGHIHQDALARKFAWRFERDPDRGYGKMTRMQMREILAGGEWQQTAASAFGGQGSMGNGSAMRVAPLGAYFADDLELVVAEARASSLITHTHPEGIAGAIAVALGAAAATQLRNSTVDEGAKEFFEAVLSCTPDGQVRRGIVLASQTPRTVPVESVAKALGNGSLVTAPDTVPLTLWCAAHHLDNYVEALATTISAGGDCDTNAAIVGGIVALSAGSEAIPQDWREAKER
ncbi:MAG TPA: ADP-ribosylglycohydrolase family protein [Verrucomicrobiae bacterium]|jgi:ADP-ribosylglycohydrolase|nr:ADP-ribosylglycohydrolase family protein [Verrucomicrobiae bacterium]